MHDVAAGTLCQQVCVKTSSPPTGSLRGLGIPAINRRPSFRPVAAQNGFPAAISLWVWYLPFPTLCAYSLAPGRGTIEVCLVTHHISHGVWSPVEAGGGEPASTGPSGPANETLRKSKQTLRKARRHSPQPPHTQIVVKDFCGTWDIIHARRTAGRDHHGGGACDLQEGCTNPKFPFPFAPLVFWTAMRQRGRRGWDASSSFPFFNFWY